ncbi:MAG TPA: hypothetical protein VF587_09395 [Solirubrobacteraceae bacterium]|jgi:hypothetical protein
MTDDVEETLAGLEQRLRALQAELDEPPLEPPPAPAPRITRKPVDPLDRFGAALRDLVAVWEQTAAEMRGDAAEAVLFRGGVAVEARADLAGLCALDRALRDVPAVSSVTLRAYAGGAAALEVGLADAVALVPELRRSLAFSVLALDERRLTIAVESR